MIPVMATVTLTTEARAEFESLPVTIQARVRKLQKRLEAWPWVSGTKALRGGLVGWFRLRTGDYRVRFYVDGDHVVIDKIGHRKDVYED
jgi:mRNA interferase RelE/StbE